MRPAFHPGLAELPAEIAIFPLTGALLLPGGKLPLNIFEPRYLAMTQDALANRRCLGMIQPNPAEARRPTGPGLYRVGCLGRLSQFAETEDGRFLITLSGLIRFTVAEEFELSPGGYRRIRPAYTAFAADLDPPPAMLDRAALQDAMRPYFRSQGIGADWDAIKATPDAALVTTLAQACPFEPREKQALLEAADLVERTEMLIALMQIGAAGGGPAADEAPPPRSKLS